METHHLSVTGHMPMLSPRCFLLLLSQQKKTCRTSGIDVQPPPWEKESTMHHPGEAKHLEKVQWYSVGCPFAFCAPRCTAQPTAKSPWDASNRGGVQDFCEDQPVFSDYQQMEDAHR